MMQITCASLTLMLTYLNATASGISLDTSGLGVTFAGKKD